MKQALSRQKLISNFILAASLSLIGFWGIGYIIKHQKEESNLIALGLGGPGLLISAWQTLIAIENARNEKLNKMFAEFEKTLAEMRRASEQQDLRHDQQLLELTTKQSFVLQKIDLHSELFGHPEMIRELFAIKDKINALNANVALITQQGRVVHQLDTVQFKIAQLSKIVEGLFDTPPCEKG
jgi:hypothetical protein